MHDLWVEKDARRQGIGRDLFKAVRSWAEGRRVRWLQWHGGRTSAPFYAALGITPIKNDDEAHPFYEIEFEDNR